MRQRPTADVSGTAAKRKTGDGFFLLLIIFHFSPFVPQSPDFFFLRKYYSVKLSFYHKEEKKSCFRSSQLDLPIRLKSFSLLLPFSAGRELHDHSCRDSQDAAQRQNALNYESVLSINKPFINGE